MAGEAIRVEGLEEAERLLRELPRKLRFGAIRKGLRAAGRVIQTEARANAPVLQTATKHRIRGLVRRSITVKASRIARQRGDVGVYVTVRRLTAKQVREGKEAGFAAGKNPRDPFYFRFLEKGTRKMTARPFLGPALQAKSEEATRAFSDELRRAIVMANQNR